VPLAIALGLLRGRLYAARTLQRLVNGLRGRPDAQELRVLMSRALADPLLSIAYWLEEPGRWVDADGHAVVLPDPASAEGRVASVLHNASGGPEAALVHDAALLEEPALLDAVADSMQVALESHRLDVEIKASTAREASVAQAERHRIERDLHDGAQQRLIALRMKLSVAEWLLDQNPRRAALLIGELGSDVEAAIVELRSLARGVVPPLLVERGLAAALREAAQRSALPVRTEIHEVGRCAGAIENAVYFCCLEALQNAAENAGPGATADLALRRDGDVLAVRVAGDGAGAAIEWQSATGHGLANCASASTRLAVTSTSTYFQSGDSRSRVPWPPPSPDRQATRRHPIRCMRRCRPAGPPHRLVRRRLISAAARRPRTALSCRNTAAGTRWSRTAGR